MVKKSINKANEEAVYDMNEIKYYNVFELSMPKKLLKSDPVIAIASLRIGFISFAILWITLLEIIGKYDIIMVRLLNDL